jgi:hypothetical protein|tara:strand:- start:257 stop:589 length:333 start_codon:yes stop_codon:yes gene_type:complete
MTLEYKWVQREPMCEHDSEGVCQWVLTLRCFGWRDGAEGEPDAVAFKTETVPCVVCKPVDDYSPESIEEFSEALRRLRKWDEKLKADVVKQLYPKVTIPGWSNEKLKRDS